MFSTKYQISGASFIHGVEGSYDRGIVLFLCVCDSENGRHQIKNTDMNNDGERKRLLYQKTEIK